jgi:hypothetical protein
MTPSLTFRKYRKALIVVDHTFGGGVNLDGVVEIFER